MSTSFQAQVFQNTYLPQGSETVHAVVTVTASRDAESLVETSSNAPIVVGLLIDCSGSMGEDGGKRLEQAKNGVRAALELIRNDCYFFVIAGWDEVEIVTPLCQATVEHKLKAEAAVTRLTAGGSTHISKWLAAARDQFPADSRFIRQALLLTDGINDENDNFRLNEVLASCAGRFQCDARGVGVDWHVEQLRAISTRLLGTVDIIPKPHDIAEDFRGILEHAMTRTISEARLRLWTPMGAKIEFCRQVSPAIVELTNQAIPNPQSPTQIRDYPLGAWSSNEERDYHLQIRVKPGAVGQRMLAGKVSIVISNGVTETKVTESQILANWTDDDTRSAIINPEVAHYTGQSELAQTIKEGLEARRLGNDEAATRKLGRAVQLAASTGNESTTKLLRKVVDVVDEDTGTIRLRRGVDDADAMALDTRSTKTTRRISKS